MAKQAYKGNIELAFDYKASETAKVVRQNIIPERISYLVIDRSYENVNILPVIYISMNVSSKMYTQIVNTMDYSQFYLKIKKKNALSKNAVYEKVTAGLFNYVAANTNANYSQELNESDTSGNAYKNITIGLVSDKMTNILRKSFNGFFNNTNSKKMIKLALDGIPGDMIMEPLKYNHKYKSCIVPPVTSRYRLLSYLFEKDPFYDSNFTFFMDFDETYLVSKNSTAVKGNDKKPANVILEIKNYTAEEAYTDGYTIENGAYRIYVNALNTNVVVNNATDKAISNIVGLDTKTNTHQKLSLTDMNKSKADGSKTTYVKTGNAGVLKNEIQSDYVLLELTKQNINSDIFSPNKVYKVKHYKDYSKYDGPYFLSYKKEMYRFTQGEEFTVTCSIGLKKCPQEEIYNAKSDTTKKKSSAVSASAVSTSSASEKETAQNTAATANANGRSLSTSSSVNSSASNIRKGK